MTETYVQPTASTPNAGAEKDEYERLKLAYERAKTKRANWLTMFQDCYDYAMPSRTGFYAVTQGASRTNRLFDSTAVTGTQNFASQLQAGLTPNFTRWAILEPGSAVKPDEVDDVKKKLEEVTQVIFDILENSNLQPELHEAFQDVGVGTGCLIVEETDDPERPLNFCAEPLPNLILDAGPYDNVGWVFRERRVKAGEITVRWKKAKLPKALADKARNQPAEEILFVECVYCDYDDPASETHQFRVFCPEVTAIIVEETYKGEGSNPVIPFRWSKASGEVYGRGPVLNALPDIKTCNLIVEMTLEHAEMAIAGMWQYPDDGSVNVDNVQLVPGTMIPVLPGHEMKPLTPGGDLRLADLLLSDLRNNIRMALYDQPLGSPDKTPMKAAEVHARMGDLARRTGSAYGRLQYELIQPLFQRIVYILKKRGIIKLPRVNGREIRVVATSPLARQQNFMDVEAIGNSVSMVSSLFGPAIANLVFNSTRAAQMIVDKTGAPKAIVNSAAEQKQLAAAIGQMTAQHVQQGGSPMDLAKVAM